ncbi:MAG: hypothetical protein HQK54_12065 [Oligoflexales bacterium]|nr:hypothetical protein [Oligoflexales bacterium]
MSWKVVFGIALLGIYLSSEGFSDQYHYANIIIGDRAMGLGGAYCGVADDASGVYYNPAGLAFALNNDISGSANAFYNRRITYKKTIGESNFVEKSGGTMAPFLGGLQKLDNIHQGLVSAFGFYTTDSDLKDQDDYIPVTPELGIRRFHRAVNFRASTGGIAVAAAKRLTPNFAAGFSIHYLSINELLQEYQDSESLWSAKKTDPTAPIYVLEVMNSRQYLTATGLAPSLGMQWALSPDFSLGLNVKFPTITAEKLDYSIERTKNYRDGDSNVLTDENIPAAERGKVVRAIATQQTVKKPLGKIPTEFRLGAAWFATTRILWTFDITSFSATKGDISLYERKSVMNYASGFEYYVTSSIPIRFGLFTNSDARPEPVSNKTDQPDHIDYTGMSLFFAWVQPNSQIALGGIAQNGTGKSQKLAGSSKIQNVEAVSTTLAFSATHNF